MPLLEKNLWGFGKISGMPRKRPWKINNNFKISIHICIKYQTDAVIIMAIHSIPCVPDKLPPGLDFDNSCYFKIEENPSGSSNYPSWSLLSSFRGRPWAGVKLKLAPDLQGKCDSI